MPPLLRVEWTIDTARLVAVEPTADQIRAAASDLAAGYNEPHNRAMLANTVAFSPTDVIEHYARMAGEGARPFLLYKDGVVAGDADLRNLDPERGTGELALLIRDRAQQGKGLGTRFALMLHALAIRELGLRRLYVTIVPENAASLRLFQKLGYCEDATSEARAYADSDRDVAMSVDLAALAAAHASSLAQIVTGKATGVG
jgi:RimJ/RimL family protein N-acetyltransferase